MPENLPTNTKEPTFEDLLKDPNNTQAHTLEEWRIMNLTTGEIIWKRPRNPLITHTGHAPQWVYQPALVDELCAAIVEGGSLTLLCDGNRFPTYAQFCRWRRLHPEINEQLDQARRDRAERLRDLAYIEAMQAQNKNDAPAQALKVETLKWMAGTDDARFKQNAKLDVAMAAPTSITVYTGIERNSDVNVRTVQEIHTKSEDTKKSE